MVLLVSDIDKSDGFEQEIPKEFICDVIGGEVFLYKGWREAMKNQKTKQEIMGCSGMQAKILYLIERFFFKTLDDEDYILLGNEVGIKTDKSDLFSLDKAVFSNQDLPEEKITRGFVDVPPLVVFEVDVNVDTGEESVMHYVSKKVQALLDFGVEKVIWIFGVNEKIIIAEIGKQWVISNWNEDIDVIDGHILNLEKLNSKSPKSKKV